MKRLKCACKQGLTLFRGFFEVMVFVNALVGYNNVKFNSVLDYRNCSRRISYLHLMNSTVLRSGEE